MTTCSEHADVVAILLYKEERAHEEVAVILVLSVVGNPTQKCEGRSGAFSKEQRV